MPLTNLHLKRIHWTIFSPSLLSYPFSTGYVQDEEHREAIVLLLRKLDEDPEQVDAHFNALRRLPMGKYFEQLLFFILRYDDRYEVMLQNHQIIEKNHTVGELDLILKDTRTGKLQHWEIALKYYLQSLPVSDQRVMLGPNAIDNLAKKMQRLKNHQLLLSDHADIQNIINSQSIDKQLFTKGQFFYHLNNVKIIPDHADPLHENGWWCFLSEAEKMLDPALKWTTLWKPDWIGPHWTADGSTLLSHRQMLRFLHSHFRSENHSMLCVGLKPSESGWQEHSRGFVVNENWPHLIPTI